MYLKEIEMQGFKSFADKTKVVFDQGVTAVVGPNGSGKSNITESLRWALGESSAKSLRGGKMPDVIFAGTETRKPLNYAQVAVTLDNKDGFIPNAGDDIRVERHIYRNGDSDYLINGKKVRLRDIHDLFMDTGLGRDSFSIISQGRVEAIFNSKPEERRSIFEEAAGVLKYKTRKKETEAKLKQTQDNLDRLEDIIYELDNQLKPLEKQAEIARQFLSLDKDRQDLHLAILVEDIRHYKTTLATYEVSHQELKQALQDYEVKRGSLEVSNQQLKERRHQLSNNIDQQQSQLLQLTNLIADYERRIEIIQLESSQKAEKQASAKEQLAELEVIKSQLQADVTAKEIKLNDLLSTKSSLEQEIAKFEEELKRFATSPEQLMDKIRDDFLALMQKESDISNRLTLIESDLSKEEERLANREDELGQIKSELDVLAKEDLVAKEKHNSYQKQLAELRKQYQVQSKHYDSLKQTYQKEQGLLFNQLDEIKSKEAKKQSLESIQRNHSQFFAGVKAVLQHQKELSGILGAVSEHLSFERRYQTALEIALGGSSQHIIVADEKAAKAAIAFLKQNRQGRATFLPLTTIKARSLSPVQSTRLSDSQGFLGMASDLVTFAPELRHIFENLLGITAIFDTIDNANKAAKVLNYQVRIVTLDGTELRPGGSFAGGANKQNSTVFVKPELDALTAELSVLKANMKEQEQVISQLKVQLMASEDELEQLKEEGDRTRFAEQKSEMESQQLSQRLSEVEENYQKLMANQASTHIATLLENKQNLSEQLTFIAQDKERLNQEMLELRDNKEAISAKSSSLQEQLSEKRLMEREIWSEQRFIQADLNRLQEDLEKNQLVISRTQEILLDKGDLLDKEQLPQLLSDLEKARAHLNDDTTYLSELKDQLLQCDQDLELVSKELTEINKSNEGLIRQQAHLEADIEQVSEKLSSFAKSLSEEYQLHFSEAQEKVESLDNIDYARTQLIDLKRQIKALGPVNLEAITQYDEVTERLTFLSGQKTDLDQAKDLLLSTIREMDDEVKARFKTTFESIRESFKQTFTQMFGGGSSDLILTEGDLLTAGVEISVQPPGKKIQSLNLMSGGEKALSALALLFAIIRVKTIPFVILDEVEAALDEANVKRFGDYLNRFDKSSQFIVVTHRKGTMSAADSIYGVTMQESGISKVVSVKLKEANELIKS